MDAAFGVGEREAVATFRESVEVGGPPNGATIQYSSDARRFVPDEFVAPRLDVSFEE